MDCMHDPLADGRRITTFDVIDGFNPEALGCYCDDFSLPATSVARALNQTIDQRGQPMVIAGSGDVCFVLEGLDNLDKTAIRYVASVKNFTDNLCTDMTTRPFPRFRYHPDPLATGAVKASSTTCICCGRADGFIYVGPVHAVEDLDEMLCPWCIADGSAASQFGAWFADSYPLARAGIPDEIVEEINLRTPGYESWQQEYWLSHCGDACEFHGDATGMDVSEASAETKQQWITEYGQNEEEWQSAIEGYLPGGSPAFYKFQCRHCRLILLGWDMD